MLFECDSCGVRFRSAGCKLPNPNVKFRCMKCKAGYLVYLGDGSGAEKESVAEGTVRPVRASTGKPSGPVEALRTLTSIEDLPSLPFVATKVMELTASPKSTMKQVATLILRDTALAAKVLRYSNSALYGRAGQISSLTDALVLLGFSTVKTIVIASAVKSMHSSLTHGYSDSGKTTWSHSVESAIAARLLASKKRKELMEEAFVVGLLHDIGKIVIESRLPGAALEITNLKKQSDQTLEEIERKVLGVDHSQVGALLCRKWNFPELLEEAILYHHNPAGNKTMPILSHIPNLSDAISHHLALPPAERADNELKLLEMESCEALKISGKTLSAVIEETHETIQRDRSLFGL